MKFRWLRGLALAVPATGGYYAAGYSSGTLGYAPIRSKSWVDNQMNTSKSISELKTNSQFLQLTQLPKVAELHGEDGAVSEVSLAFIDKQDPQHTITYVHCGPHTVGFPFLVHGGVLGTLLRHSAALATSNADGNLIIKYRRPTIVDTILKIETKKTPKGLELFIYSADTNKVLVEGTYLLNNK